MICCKIITNFNDAHGNFEKLLNTLSSYGEVLWENGYIFFGDTEHDEVNEKKVQKILKNSGYMSFFINTYAKENQPNETDDINGWLTDKLIKINYVQYERHSQQIFKDISKGLDILNQQVDELQLQQQKRRRNG